MCWYFYIPLSAWAILEVNWDPPSLLRVFGTPKYPPKIGTLSRNPALMWLSLGTDQQILRSYYWSIILITAQHHIDDAPPYLSNFPVSATWSSGKLFIPRYTSSTPPSFLPSYVQKVWEPYMFDRIIDGPPLNYGISKTPGPFCNLTSETPSWSIITSRSSSSESVEPVSWNSISDSSIPKMRCVESSLNWIGAISHRLTYFLQIHVKDPCESIGYYILGSRDVLYLKTELRGQDPPSD